MLLGKDGSGDQDCHLHAVLDCLKGGPDGDLGLAKAHIPADQTVHDPV